MPFVTRGGSDQDALWSPGGLDKARATPGNPSNSLLSRALIRLRKAEADPDRETAGAVF